MAFELTVANSHLKVTLPPMGAFKRWSQLGPSDQGCLSWRLVRCANRLWSLAAPHSQGSFRACKGFHSPLTHPRGVPREHFRGGGTESPGQPSPHTLSPSPPFPLSLLRPLPFPSSSTHFRPFLHTYHIPLCLWFLKSESGTRHQCPQLQETGLFKRSLLST